MKDKKAIKAMKRLKRYADQYSICEDGCIFLRSDGFRDRCMLGGCPSLWDLEEEMKNEYAHLL